jgi:hypothetical protein
VVNASGGECRYDNSCDKSYKLLAFEYLAKVTRFFIAPLVYCLRSPNGISQREADFHPWCLHRFGTVYSFLDARIGRCVMYGLETLSFFTIKSNPNDVH